MTEYRNFYIAQVNRALENGQLDLAAEAADGSARDEDRSSEPVVPMCARMCGTLARVISSAQSRPVDDHVFPRNRRFPVPRAGRTRENPIIIRLASTKARRMGWQPSRMCELVAKPAAGLG